MIEEYLSIITSEHREQPKYMAVLSAYLETLQHVLNILNAWNEHFHLEDAVGNQLDLLGEIVGRRRVLNFQPEGYSARLDDENYRLILKAKILQNQWDGTIAGMQALFQSIFPDQTLVLIDNQDMTMRATVVGLADSLQVQLLNHGYILPKPEGVRLHVTTIQNKIFAYDRQTEAFGGYDEGEWL